MTEPTNAVLTSLRRTADTRPEAVALRLFGDDLVREITFDALRATIDERAHSFQQAGIRPGDRVALLGENSPGWLMTLLTLFQLAATAVPFDSKLTGEELHQLVQRTAPVAIILDEKQHAAHPALAPDIMRIRMETGCIIVEGYPDEIPSDAPRPADLDPNIGSIVFTSGSTAQPKGVVLSIASMLYAVQEVAQRVEISASSDLLCVLPFHHVLGTGVCLGIIRAGGTVTLLQELRSDLLLKALQTTHTTVLPGTPRLFELLLTNINARIADMSAPVQIMIRLLQFVARQIRAHSNRNPGRILFRKLHDQFGGRLETFVSGGAALPMEICSQLETFGFTVFEGYGLTETTGIISINSRICKRAGTVGQPLTKLDVRIANPDVMGEGEILVKGATVMQGYLDDPEATANVFRDGWLRTGDIGRLDRDGFVSITGRISDLIVTPAGKNVSPEAVELSYRGIPDIQEMVVLGMPGAIRYGEEVHAAVVPQSTETDVEQRIRDAVTARSATLPSYMRIQRLYFVQEIPRTTTFKVQRGVLRKKLLAETSDPTETPAARTRHDGADLTRKVIRVVRGIVGSKNTKLKIEPHSTLLFDLSMDSLGFVELASGLHREFNVTVELTHLQVCKTIQDVAQLIRTSLGKEHAVSATPSLSFQLPPPRMAGSLMLLRRLRTVLEWLWHLKVDGLDNLPSTDVFLLCPNHASHLDALFVLPCLPAGVQESLCIFAKREHFEKSLMRLVVRFLRAVPVDRQSDPIQALEVGAALLKAGRPVLIFPEGTRTRDGSLQPFRRGAAHLALHTGVPLIPVRIDGAYTIYPSHARVPKFWSLDAGQPLRLHIRIGTPIVPPQWTHDAETERTLTEQVRQAIENMGRDDFGNV